MLFMQRTPSASPVMLAQFPTQSDTAAAEMVTPFQTVLS